MKNENSKQHLFEMMHKVGGMALNEDYMTSVSSPDYQTNSTSNVNQDNVQGDSVNPLERLERIKAANPNMYIIVPSDNSNESGNIISIDNTHLKPARSMYLHGELEDMVGFDLFSFYGDAPTEEGNYHGVVVLQDDNVKATITLKNGRFGLTGYVTKFDDEKSSEFVRNPSNYR